MTAKHFTESDFLLQQFCGLGFWRLSFLKLRSFRIRDAVYLCGSLHKPPLFLNSKSITLLFPPRTSRITVPFKSFPLTLSNHNKARGFFQPRTGRVGCIKSILTRLKIYAFLFTTQRQRLIVLLCDTWYLAFLFPIPRKLFLLGLESPGGRGQAQ